MTLKTQQEAVRVASPKYSGCQQKIGKSQTQHTGDVCLSR